MRRSFALPGFPAVEKEVYAHKGRGIQKKRDTRSGRSHNQPAQARSHCPRDVKARRIKGDGRSQFWRRNQVRGKRLPCRIVHDRAHAQQEGEDQQQLRRHRLSHGQDAQDPGSRHH